MSKFVNNPEPPPREEKPPLVDHIVRETEAELDDFLMKMGINPEASNLDRATIHRLASEAMKAGGDFNTEKSTMVPDAFDVAVPVGDPVKKKVFVWSATGIFIVAFLLTVLWIVVFAGFFWFITDIGIVKSVAAGIGMLVFRWWWRK
jgi:hypothetical protein